MKEIRCQKLAKQMHGESRMNHDLNISAAAQARKELRKKKEERSETSTNEVTQVKLELGTKHRTKVQYSLVC